MHPSEKITKQLTVRGGGKGSTLTVSLTVKYPGFFTTSLSLCNKNGIDEKENLSFIKEHRTANIFYVAHCHHVLLGKHCIFLCTKKTFQNKDVLGRRNAPTFDNCLVRMIYIKTVAAS